MSKKGWGFDIKNIDKKARPQDDFYRYAVGGWLKSHTIPPSEVRWGSFNILHHKTYNQLRTLLIDIQKLRSVKPGSPEQMIRDFYRSGVDMKRRNALGITPLQKWRKKVAAIRSRDDLLKVVGELHRLGVGALWGAGIDQDMKNADRYQLHLFQDGIGMPDRDYYLLDGTEQKRVRTAYLPYMVAMLRCSGYDQENAENTAQVIYKLEERLAKVSMKKEDAREPSKTYHKYTVRELASLVPSVDWKRYLKVVGTDVRDVNVMQPVFFREIQKILTHEPLENLKAYLDWHLVNDMAGLLSQKFVALKFSFYGTVLTGQLRMRPLWRRILSAVDSRLDEQVGRLYIERYFSKDAKEKAKGMVEDLLAVYESRIKALDWMSNPTKKRALKKLRSMKTKLAYPDKWKSYKGLVIRPDDYFGNALRSNEFEHKRAMRKLKKPVDHTEWYSSPQTVNAFYNPGMNDMLFPAGILQHPFFSATADDALNYGAIGMTIGHEMTHGFDNQGAQFDSKGNHKNWWTVGDKKKFNAKGAVIKKQFDQFIVEGLPVNGKLTLGENIADLGGLLIAYYAYERRLEKTGRKIIDGFTPEQRFFLAYAQGERVLERPEFAKLAILTDPHAPHVCRVNGPLSNMPEFYEAFGVKKGDKLYKSPAARAKIW